MKDDFLYKYKEIFILGDKMAIKILIRKQRMSPYKRAIEEMIDIDGDTLIIATGYIYNSTNDNNKKCVENLAKCISKNISKRKLDVKVLCGYGNDTKQQAKDFCTNLKREVNNTNLKIELYLLKKMNWHGKICIKKDANNNYAALIGSSNFTPVNLLENSIYFNIESDIYMLNKQFIKNKKDFDEMKINLKYLKKDIEDYGEIMYRYISNIKHKLGKDIKPKEEVIRIAKNLSKEKTMNYEKQIKKDMEQLQENERDKVRDNLENFKLYKSEFDKLSDCINILQEIDSEVNNFKFLVSCYKEENEIDRELIIKNIEKIKNAMKVKGNEYKYKDILNKYKSALMLYNQYMIAYNIQLMGYKTKDLIDGLSFKIEEILSNKDMVHLCEDWDE